MNPLKSESKDSQDWLDEILGNLLDDYNSISKALNTGDGTLISTVSSLEAAQAKAVFAIREHFLKEALEMIGEDEDNIRAIGRNQLRQELRNKFNDKYKED
jgi:hypothetical protein